MEYINDEFILYSLVTLIATVGIFVTFLIAYKKINEKIRLYEIRRKEELEKEKKKSALGKENIVAELEKEFNLKIEKIQSELNEKIIRSSTLIFRIKNITSSMNPQVIIKEIQEIIKSNLSVSKYSIYLKKRDSNFLQFAAGSSPIISDKVEDIEVTSIPLIAHAFYAKKLVHVNDSCPDSEINKLLQNSDKKYVYALPFITLNENGELEPNGALLIEKLEGQNSVLSNDELTLLTMLSSIVGNALNNAYDFESSKKFSEEQLLEKKRLTKIFSKYVSPQVVEELLKNPDSTNLGGQKQKTTIMFADIRGFTSMSEKLDPETIVGMLNEYFSEMSNIIFTWNGTLDKYIGDAMMVLFGAPIVGEDDELRAVSAALEMQKKLVKINENFERRGMKKINIGIGINTGYVVVGNIGSETRLEYTAIGDSVNLASRLCSIAKPGQIIISEYTYDYVKDYILVNKLEMVQVKGKTEKVQIYEVTGLK